MSLKVTHIVIYTINIQAVRILNVKTVTNLKTCHKCEKISTKYKRVTSNMKRCYKCEKLHSDKCEHLRVTISPGKLAIFYLNPKQIATQMLFAFLVRVYIQIGHIKSRTKSADMKFDFFFRFCKQQFPFSTYINCM